jgi:predicted anti-sigma-YlaC factor YlaD
MLNCKQVAAVCSLELERPLGWTQQLSLHAHLMICTGCRNYREQLKTLRHAMRAYAQCKAAVDERERCGSR